jgi:hypothetical protein
MNNRFVLFTLAALLLAPLAAVHAAEAPKPSALPLAVEGNASVFDVLGTGFQNPPPSARPWVYWFWINGNISKEGITADLEAFKRVGIGGVLWMEVSGPAWTPDGDVEPLSTRWHEAFQWAVRECERLGIEFDVSVDFGYGSGGPHITPELSMQQLVWSEKEVEGGQPLSVVLDKPHVEKKVFAWLRPGAKINETVLQKTEQSDSFRDVAVLAIPLPASQKARAYRIAGMDAKAGLHWNRPAQDDLNRKPPPGAVTPMERVIDLTGLMDRDGRLRWDAPPGKWLVIRFGHASNFKMTRPCPQAAVGLECDRLARTGIEAHFDAFLKKIIDGAGRAAGGTLAYAHIDSWEAGGQNSTASFPDEFRSRRGYNLRPWLPVRASVIATAWLCRNHLFRGKLSSLRNNLQTRTGRPFNKELAWFKEERKYEPDKFPGELYDLSRDLAEHRNLYGEHPDKVRELKTLLEKYKNEGRSAPRK